MKSRKWTPVVAMTLFAALAMPVAIGAQDNSAQDHKPKHQQYKLIDLGTFGGPDSAVGGFGTFLNNRGTAVGGADTSIPDPYSPNCFDPECFVQHASQWRDGALTDLGALSGVNSSYAGGISANGLIAGLSQNGLIDPLLGVPESQAVLWNDGEIIDLGTLGGNESFANNVNNRGHVVGPAANAILDPYSMFGWGTQTRAFLWKNGVMQDLGTLGGPDAAAFLVNSRGQVAGQAYTNSTPNPVTGVPTTDPFLWERGVMRDLGTLGGTLSFTNGLNDRGQVVGQSNLLGDLVFHPFLWDRGALTDLGTLGGDNGFATVINEKGEVTGRADVPGSKAHHGFLWTDGVMTDLGTVNGTPCSTGYAINQSGQIVGTSGICGNPGYAFLWENRGPAVDLNLLVAPGSGLEMTEAVGINDSGEISGIGTVSTGDVHAYLLIPDGECDDDCEGRIAASQNNVAPAQNALTTKQGSESLLSPAERIRSMMRQRYHLPGQAAAPRD